MHIIRITSPQRRPARRFSLTAFSHAEAYGHSPAAWARPWVFRARQAAGQWITVRWPTCDFETWRLAQGLQDHPNIEVDGDRIRWVEELV